MIRCLLRRNIDSLIKRYPSKPSRSKSVEVANRSRGLSFCHLFCCSFKQPHLLWFRLFCLLARLCAVLAHPVSLPALLRARLFSFLLLFLRPYSRRASPDGPGQIIHHIFISRFLWISVFKLSARDHLFGRHPRVSHCPNTVRFAHSIAPLHHGLQHSTPLRPSPASVTLSDFVSCSSVSVPSAQDCALSTSDVSNPDLVVNKLHNKTNGYLATSSSTGLDLTIDQVENCLEIMHQGRDKGQHEVSSAI